MPASQLDRFGVVLRLGRPDRAAGTRILAGQGGFPQLARLAPVVDVDRFRALAATVVAQHVEARVGEFVLDICDALWASRGVLAGPSARASLGLLDLARALALVDGRSFVTPGDVRAAAGPSLAHRIVIDGVVDLASAERHVRTVVAGVTAPGPG